MTASAQSFITPLTLSTLSENPVLTEFAKDKTGEWNNHVELGLWADVYLIAPVTANTLGKLANAIADNLLNAVYLSARCPVIFAPAMDLDMYQHPSVRDSLEKLKSFGNKFIDSEYGELASGLIGEGRMAEPEHIIAYLEGHFNKELLLSDKKILITAGPTYEAIDPVRFVGNHSTGKMGLALALEAKSQGAQVKLVLGPNSLPHDQLNEVEVIPVTTAQEMYQASADNFANQDVVILAAAVADYTPDEPAEEKIKKSTDKLDLKLSKTVDIAGTLGTKKKAQFMVGFALETENAEENARQKLEKKNLDMIVLNSLREPGAGFGHDTNRISIFTADNKKLEFQLKSKTEVAKDIINEVAKRI
jgi:phosphopantothenoylcysteine decarboxylase/phosphopantothenate--cysteine ligase